MRTETVFDPTQSTVTAAGVSLAVRIGMVGGRGTLAGADSSVVARTTGGGRVTTGIIVDETLVGV